MKSNHIKKGGIFLKSSENTAFLKIKSNKTE